MFLRRPREVAEGSLSKTLQAGEASAQSMYCNLKCTPFGVCLFGGRIWYGYILPVPVVPSVEHGFVYVLTSTGMNSTT